MFLFLTRGKNVAIPIDSRSSKKLVSFKREARLDKVSRRDFGWEA